MVETRERCRSKAVASHQIRVYEIYWRLFFLDAFKLSLCNIYVQLHRKKKHISNHINVDPRFITSHLNVTSCLQHVRCQVRSLKTQNRPRFWSPLAPRWRDMGELFVSWKRNISYFWRLCLTNTCRNKMFCHSTPRDPSLSVSDRPVWVPAVKGRRLAGRFSWCVIRMRWFTLAVSWKDNIFEAAGCIVNHFTSATVVIRFENVTKCVITFAQPS